MLWHLFLARVCVTVQAWGRAVFCALRASGLLLLFMHAPLHVVVVLLCVVVGGPQFLEFFSVFFSILRLFSSTSFAPVLWCFSLSLLVFFVGSLEAVCFRRTLLPVFHVC